MKRLLVILVSVVVGITMMPAIVFMAEGSSAFAAGSGDTITKDGKTYTLVTGYKLFNKDETRGAYCQIFNASDPYVHRGLCR